jgi:hypothetical protein
MRGSSTFRSRSVSAVSHCSFTLDTTPPTCSRHAAQPKSRVGDGERWASNSSLRRSPWGSDVSQLRIRRLKQRQPWIQGMATERTSCLLPLLAGWPLPSPPFPLQASSRSWLRIDRTPAAPHSVSFHSASRSPQAYPACLLLLLLHRPPQVCCRQRPRTRTRCTCVHERINS